MDEESACEMVSELGYPQQKRHQDVLRNVGSWNSGSAGVMEAFQVGDHVLVTWAGSWRAVVRGKACVHERGYGDKSACAGPYL